MIRLSRLFSPRDFWSELFTIHEYKPSNQKGGGF